MAFLDCNLVLVLNSTVIDTLCKKINQTEKTNFLNNLCHHHFVGIQLSAFAFAQSSFECIHKLLGFPAAIK